jgi:glutathione S-transferase
MAALWIKLAAELERSHTEVEDQVLDHQSNRRLPKVWSGSAGVKADVMLLYHNDMSVCAAKVRTALLEKGLECDFIHLDLRAGDAQKPDYLKLNPNAVVPTLVHDGRAIIESTVICEFIDDQWPDPPLKPSDSFARAQMRLWTKQLDEGLHAAVGSLSFAIAFRHQSLARSEEERRKWLAGIPQQDRRERLQSLLELGLQSPYFAPAVRRYAKLFDDFERALEHNPWLAGERFSLAEVAYAPYLARLRHLGFDILFERHPRVTEWASRVAERPSVAGGVERWFNPKYLALFEERRPEAKLAISCAFR